jgi:hypothetical protein
VDAGLTLNVGVPPTPVGFAMLRVLSLAKEVVPTTFPELLKVIIPVLAKDAKDPNA